MNKKFQYFLHRLGFKCSEADPGLFIKKQRNYMILLAMYVNGNNEFLKKNFMDNLKIDVTINYKRFLGNCKVYFHFLGLKIIHKHIGIKTVSQ